MEKDMKERVREREREREREEKRSEKMKLRVPYLERSRSLDLFHQTRGLRGEFFYGF